MQHKGTALYPIVTTLSGLTGALGQRVTLSSDSRDYYWNVGTSAWRPITPLWTYDQFVYGPGPHSLTHNPTTDIQIRAEVDGVGYDPSKYSLASGNQFSLAATSPPTYGQDLWVYYAY